jgi:hypothetical protein
MRRLVYACCIAVGAALPTGGAEAARCKQGYIYRPSVGVCQTKAAAVRQGVYRKRVVKRKARPAAPVMLPVETWAVRYKTRITRYAERYMRWDANK